MESEIESRQYELAYHITPDIEEGELKARMGEVESAITRNDGSVVASREPKRTHLSYPIAHKHYAFLGVLDFTAPSETIDAINAQMKLQEGILRFVVVKKPAEGKGLHALGDQRPRRGKIVTHQKSAEEARRAPRPAPTPVEQEKMSKEIEDVLEKL